MQRILQGNLWKYAVILVAHKRIFLAVLGAYYLTIPNVDAAVIGLIFLVGQLAGFVLEIPSGYLSDKIGHKKALVISHVCLAASTLIFLFANNLAWLLVAVVFWSGGVAFHSGTGSAFMHETLKALGREKDYARIMGKLSAIGFAVPIVLTAAVPFLVGISFRLPFAAALVFDLIGLAAALVLVTPPVAPEEVKEISLANFRQVIREGRKLGFFPYALFSGILGGFLFGVENFRSVYQTFLELPVVWFGVLFGIGRGLASLMLAYSGKLNDAFSLLGFYRLKIILYAALFFLLAALSSPWAIAVVFIITNACHWGLSKVGAAHLLEILSPSKFKATLISVQEQIRNLAGAAVAFAVGWLIQEFSFRQAFLWAGIALVAVLVPLYLLVARKYRAAHS